MSANLVTNTDRKLLLSTKFPPEFNTKVDIGKVNLPLIKKWVSDQIYKLMGMEDDIVTDLISNHLEGSKTPNIKELQIQLSGFLDKDTPAFCLELWKLCISAQANKDGVPQQLLDAKKLEILNEKKEEERLREETRKRQEAERQRERELSDVRDRERGARDRGRGSRFNRGFDRRSPRPGSQSPVRRRADDDYQRERRVPDSYVPSHRDSDRADRRRSPDRGRAPKPAPPERRRRRNSSSTISDSSRSRTPSPARRRRRRRSPTTSPAPPRRRRRSPSSSRSRSRERGSGRRYGYGYSRGYNRDSRSPSPRYRRRERPAAPPRRRRNSSSSVSRSPQPPPPKKRRRNSSSSPSPSPPPVGRGDSVDSPIDLTGNGVSRNKGRLSRQITDSEDVEPSIEKSGENTHEASARTAKENKNETKSGEQVDGPSPHAEKE